MWVTLVKLVFFYFQNMNNDSTYLTGYCESYVSDYMYSSQNYSLYIKYQLFLLYRLTKSTMDGGKTFKSEHL